MNETRPMVICGSDGVPVDVVLQSEKGFRKSIEQGQIWALHSESGRLLPYGDGVSAVVTDHGSWFLARIEASSRSPVGNAGELGSQATDGAGRVTVPDTGGGDGAADDASQIGTVLTRLAAVIRGRHQEMPEGSYTTHLFSSGGEKIRKKVGEESVEVVLAGDRASLVGEVADLLYHVLVLLENEGIELGEIAAELDSR